ncbi:MAG: type II toxin-antitoxin system death-on-curing family toxin [Marmoricola sp.]
MSQDVVYLDLDDLLAAAEAIHGRPADVRDYGLLESALARPRASVFGEDAYPDLDQKSAALLASLVGNHALVDGNKRLGLLAVYLFYGLNGRSLRQASDDELFDLVLDVATRRVPDVTSIAGRLTRLVVPEQK